jgi:hypothetical protein
MIRVTARGVLVRDLDDTLRRLSANLDWEPAGPVEHLRREGYRRARMAFTLAHSACVDILEPTQWDSEAGYSLHNWGPGPYYTRISVHDLEAKADDLRSRGTAYTLIRIVRRSAAGSSSGSTRGRSTVRSSSSKNSRCSAMLRRRCPLPPCTERHGQMQDSSASVQAPGGRAVRSPATGQLR